MDLRQEILDGFQAASLLLVFVVMLFTLRYPTIITAIEKELPDVAKVAERQRVARELRGVLWAQCVPPAVVSFAAVCLMTPLAIRAVTASAFWSWTSGFLEKTYVFITILNWAVFVWTVILGVRLACRVRSVQRSGTPRRKPE